MVNIFLIHCVMCLFGLCFQPQEDFFISSEFFFQVPTQMLKLNSTEKKLIHFAVAAMAAIKNFN